MFRSKLIKPFYDSENQGGASGAQTLPPVAVPQTIEPKGDDITGLVNKNTQLLGELKTLKEKNKVFLDEIEKAKTDGLAEQGKFKELYETSQKTNALLTNGLKESGLKLIAKDMINPDYILSHKDKFTYDDKMNITNGQEVLTQLKTTDPFLFQTAEQTKLKTDSGTPLAYTPGKTLTLAQLQAMSRADRLKNADFINDQVSKGLVT